MKIFRAPNDITGGAIWEEELKEKISNCDIVLTILTENYYDSEWPVQEIGVAWILGKRILPLSFNETEPRGYIKNFQAKPFTLPLNFRDIEKLL